MIGSALMVHDPHTDDILSDSGIFDRQRHAAERHTAVIDRLGCCQNPDRFFTDLNLVWLDSVINGIAALIQPEAVRKFHW